MSQILDLGKLRFHFAGNWSAGTTYESNDIVKYGGNVYVYTNPVRTSGNLPTDTAYWALMVEGFKFQGVFDAATQYRVGDGVAHGGVVYIAVADSQGQTPPNASYWSQFADGIQWEGEYDAVAQYQKNDLVSYSGQVYVATQDTSGNAPTNVSYWDKFVTGISPEGVYNAGTTYVPGDLVAYGANIYRCIQTTTGIVPTDIVHWELFLQGNDYRGTWSNATSYTVGQTVRFGGVIYKALADNTAAVPSESVDVQWAIYQTGVNTRGDWATSTYYAVGDVVVYGGNTYYCEISHTSGTFNDDLTAVGGAKWSKFNSGVRYLGEWTSGTSYLKDDIVSYSVSTYICPVDHTAGADFFIDLAANKWESFVVGAAYVLPDTAGNAGKYLQTPDGLNYSWQFAGANDKIYYVTEDATSSADDADHGQSIDYAFASLRYACDYIAADLANRAPATIFVKDGTYSEQLPIVVPENVTIVGDGQRNCIIQPAAGLSDDGVTPNNQSTMFYLSSGVMIEGLLMQGMTGFSMGPDAHDIETATIGGVYCRLNPNSTILKSPYVKESSAFSTGGVGAIIDGSVGPEGSGGSMVFHTFTQVHDGGVGFWVKDRGLAEIVSCFTYYCDFGFAATGGGKIRALNCNNSYGTYGSVSEGYDTDEQVLSGTMYGDTLTYDATTLTDSGGFTVGDVVTAPSYSDLTVSSLSIATQAVVTTSSAHGLYDGQPVSFTGVNEAVWQPLLGDQAQDDRRTWYVDVVSDTTFKLCSNFDLTNYFDTRSVAGWGFVIETITDATRANPVVLTMSSHGFTSGETISEISGVGGMTELNGNTYYVSVVDANRVALYSDAGLSSSVDGTNFGAYTSGGQGTRTLVGTTLSGATLTVGHPKAIIRNIQTNLGTGEHRVVISDIKLGNTGHTYKVSVNASDKAALNGVTQKALTLYTTRQYVFEQNDLSNVGKPLFLSETQDGTAYTTGVSYWLDGEEVADYAAYSTGFAAATAREVRFQPTAAVTLYYNTPVAEAGAAITVLANDANEWDAFTGPTLYPFIDGTTITAQDGVAATLIGSDAHIGQVGFALVLGGLSAEPVAGGSIEFVAGPAYNPADNADITEAYNDGTDTRSYIITAVSGWDAGNGTATVTISQEKLDTADSYYGQRFNIRYNYSQIRLTGHDFLSIGTGGKTTTNYPGAPLQAPAQGNEVVETLPGRVYYVSTDQDGNFRIGNYFRVDQATGRATLDASAFDLSGLTSLRLGSIGAQLGESINEFSSDGTLSGNSNIAVPTEQATKTYVDTRVPQAIPTSVGQENKVLTSAGAAVNWTALSLSEIVGATSIFAQTGTEATYSYSVFSNSLLTPTWTLDGTVPSGVLIDPATGVLTIGSAVTAGTYSFDVVAVGAENTGTLTETLSLVINDAYPIYSATVFPDKIQDNVAFSSTATQASALTGTVVHTVTGGALPPWATLASNGVLSGTTPSSPLYTYLGPYVFTVTATNGDYSNSKPFVWSPLLGLVQGQQQYTSAGTYSWIAPTAVTEVSVVAVGGGGAGQDNWANPAGSGGGLGWKNNIPVVPGQSYTVVVGAGGTSTTSSGSSQLLGGDTYFISRSTVCGYGGGHSSGVSSNGPNNNSYGGGYYGDGGGAGGYAGSYPGGGGAGGYTGRGYNQQETWNASNDGGGGGGYYSSTYGTGAGGGVGLQGQTGYPSPGNPFYTPWTGYTNSSGQGGGGTGAHGGGNGYYGENPFSGNGQSSSNIRGGNYGGGGGGPGSSWPNASGNGGSGGLRIIWGDGRAFPNTNTADVTPSGPA